MDLPTNGRKASRTASGPRQLLADVGSFLFPRRHIIENYQPSSVIHLSWRQWPLMALSLQSQSKVSRTSGQGICAFGTVKAKAGRSGRACRSQHIPKPRGTHHMTTRNCFSGTPLPDLPSSEKRNAKGHFSLLNSFHSMS